MACRNCTFCLFVCLCRPSLSFRSAKIRCNGVIPHFWELIFVWLFKFLDEKSRKAKYPDNLELGKSFTMRKLMACRNCTFCLFVCVVQVFHFAQRKYVVMELFLISGN